MGTPTKTPLWGRATPLQSDVLRLCGLLFEKDLGDRERLRAMEVGREGLRRETGMDFGLDLGAWHEFLLRGELQGAYANPAAWEDVCILVLGALESQERRRLLELTRKD